MNIIKNIAYAAVITCAVAATPPAAHAQQVAQGATVDVNVTTACEEGNAVFKVVNKGFEWPTVAKFSVYRVKGNTLVSQRRMRLTSNQQASFRVKAGGPEQVELGIFIEPEWYGREFKFDAKVSC